MDYDYTRTDGNASRFSEVSDALGTYDGTYDGSRLTLSAPQIGTGLAGRLSGLDPALYDDEQSENAYYDSSREELIDVFAPPGKVGFVIDTPNDGAPLVHAVKDTSPLKDHLRIGDKLVAVDDVDVRTMTATKVSKLLSRKSEQPSRKLTIIRSVAM